jgi:hypothetical protein
MNSRPTYLCEFVSRTPFSGCRGLYYRVDTSRKELGLTPNSTLHIGCNFQSGHMSHGSAAAVTGHFPTQDGDGWIFFPSDLRARRIAVDVIVICCPIWP